MSATVATPETERVQVVRDMAALADERPSFVREQCADNFALFADVVTYRWLEPKPEPWYPVPDHALDWHDHLHDGNYSPMILAGRKHTKTTWVLCEILYAHQYTDHFRTLYWCNNAENQLPARMAELEELIEANLWLDNLHRGNPDNQNNIPRGVKQKDFPNGSTLYATGVGGGIEGSHVNMVVGDDPLKEQGDVGDETIMDFYLKVIVPMADGADQSCIVGTRKRPKDIYHLIRGRTSDLDVAGYHLLEYPAIREVWLDKYGDRPDHLADVAYSERHAPELAATLDLPDETVSVLWPEARGPDFLLSKLGRQGTAAFKREWCMVFTHVEDAIIERSLVESSPTSLPGDPPATIADVDREFDRVAIGLDLALVEGGDNTAWCVLGAAGDERWVLDVAYDDGIKPERIRRTTQDLYDRFQADVIVVEKNGWQDWFADEAIQFDDHLPVRKHTTTQRKHSWQRGVPKIASDIEQGRYRFYRGDDGIEALIDGLCSLRLDDNDHLAGHTPDVVMALYMATKGLGSGGGATVDMSGRPLSDDAQADYEARRDREAQAEQALDGSPIGDALLDARDQRRRR